MALGWDDREKSTGASVGEVFANCEAMLVDAENEEESESGTEITKSYERGELWVRGPNVMKGYWRNPQATKATITSDGWLKTGDIAYVDDKKKFFIVDRKKSETLTFYDLAQELIKVKGNQVAPAELEAVLCTHRSILDAAVIGAKMADRARYLPTSGEDEQPRAYVVLRPGSNLTENAIVAYVAQRVSKIKRITAGVVFVDHIPRNPTTLLAGICRLDVMLFSGREFSLTPSVYVLVRQNPPQSTGGEMRERA
ncbi:hypothetical protein LTR84_002012 [Exophiala bonariae]|uniref:AMP-dependent synthetase/ligase domain-containing protein n=1 Tax=Exophiala bonariae TaxID=1690606 RepID=A0AAV9NA70_9EURO|nr:hypothetical protein LTR84_002012 [Exophiala bonariae]